MQKSKKSSIQKNKNSLANVAYEKIKHMIITLYYKPGEYINESEICTELNFTRAPVHQAIHRLALDRLIQIIPQKGIIVQPLSIDEMKNILEVRKLIEPYCCCLLYTSPSPRDRTRSRMPSSA